MVVDHLAAKTKTPRGWGTRMFVIEAETRYAVGMLTFVTRVCR